MRSFYGLGLNAETFGVGIQWFPTPIKQTVLFFNLLFIIFIFVV